MKSLKIIKHTSRTSTPMIRPLYIRETEYKELTGQDFVCCGWDASPQGDGYSSFIETCSAQPQFLKTLSLNTGLIIKIMEL